MYKNVNIVISMLKLKEIQPTCKFKSLCHTTKYLKIQLLYK